MAAFCGKAGTKQGQNVDRGARKGKSETRTDGIIDLDARSDKDAHAVVLSREGVRYVCSPHMGVEVGVGVLKSTESQKQKQDEKG